MNCQTRQAWLRKYIGAIVLFGALALGMSYLALPVQAQAQTPEPQTEGAGAEPPLGDCFGGALSGEPLHCYLLEQAEAEGLLSVEAMYNVVGNLYIFLRQTDGISDKTAAFLKRKATEFYDNWPNLAPRNPIYEECQRAGAGDTYRDCLLNLPFTFRSHPGLNKVDLPWPSSYIGATLWTGGAESRRSWPSWASWEQLWPVARPSGAAEPHKFDISDVDLTNFPRLDRDECFEPPSVDVYSGFCTMWTMFPESGVAGFWSVGYENEDGEMVGKVHLFAKESDNETKLDALKARLTIGYWEGQEVVVLPVEYDYADLWRWATILSRFTVSSGNTIGLERAAVFSNRDGFGDPDRLWPVEGLGPAEEHKQGRDLRPTIELSGPDHHRIAAALPTLLPQLGIPADAVGVVVRLRDDPRKLFGAVIALPDDAQQADPVVSDRPVPNTALETNELGTMSGSVEGASIQQGEGGINGQNEGAVDPAIVSGQAGVVTTAGDVASNEVMPLGIEFQVTDARTGRVSLWIMASSAAVAGLAVLVVVAFMTFRLRRRSV